MEYLSTYVKVIQFLISEILLLKKLISILICLNLKGKNDFIYNTNSKIKYSSKFGYAIQH